MKFKHIEVGMEVIICKGLIRSPRPVKVLEVNHKEKYIIVPSLFGRVMLHKGGKGQSWDVYKQPKEPEHLKAEDYEMLLDMALATRDKAWFDELQLKLKTPKKVKMQWDRTIQF